MRNNKFNTVSALLLCIIFLLSGCSSNTESFVKHIFSAPDEYKVYSEQLVASNGKYSLYWDSDTDCVLLQNKETGFVWSSIPYDFYSSDSEEGLAYVRMTSPINIEYYDTKSRSISTSYGSIDVIDDGHTASVKVKNGIKVTYFFDKYNISVPVVYSLDDDCLKATVLIKEIGEKDNKIYSITLSPFMCSTKSSDDSWLFLPSGSGTLMYADEGKRAERNASVRIYGEEFSETISQSLSSEESAYLPFFGAGNGKNAVMGAVIEGSELVRFDAQAGNSEIGYASVSPTFLVRSVDILKVSQMYSGYKSLVRKTSEEIVDASSATVCFYPLENEKANYSGMAEKCREILFAGKETTADYGKLYINFLGGANVSKNFLGINYDVLKPATTLKQSIDILNELYTATNSSPVVTLKGFTKSGLDIQKIAGGFKLASAFGSEKDLKSLYDFCKSSGGAAAVDYDIVRYSKSGNGASTLTGASITANGTRAKQYYFSKTNYLPKNTNEYYFLISREKIEDLEYKLANTIDKNGASAVSLNDLGSITYSDCVKAKYLCKNGFSNNISAFLKYLKKNKKELLLSSPNSYAAVYANYITSSPMCSSQNDAFDEDVPFYQMLMHGFVPMAVSSVNLCNDVKEGFLYAMETGSSLSYTLTDVWQDGFEDTYHAELKYSTYQLWKDTIIDNAKASNEYLNDVSSATIDEHLTVKDGVTKTVFSNGVITYVNHTQKSVSTPIGKIEAKSFKYIKE